MALGLCNTVSVILLLTACPEMQGEGSGLRFTIPGEW